MKKLPLLIAAAVVAGLLFATQKWGGVPPNVIRWTTQSEEDNFGYNVYRGSEKQGPFTRINARIIPGFGTTDIPQSYEYRDTSIEPATVYWYYVQSISLTGERVQLTPVYPSKPKSRSIW